MKHSFINFLHFSRKERIGALFLSILCVAVFAFPEIARHFREQEKSDFSRFESEIGAFRQAAKNTNTQAAEPFEFDPNTASADDLMQLGLSEKIAGIICRYRDKGGRFRAPEDLRKIWSLPEEDYLRLLPYIRMETSDNRPIAEKKSLQKAETFLFDPNTASEQDLRRLGLPAGTVKSILNYRSKGGRFKNKDDLKKIYTLDEEDYVRLESYVSINQDVSLESPRPVAYSGGDLQRFTAKTVAKNPIDINQATETEWQMLPGIGEKRASQIVKFRQSLGGFLSIEQLGEMYGLPDSVFQRIRPLLSVLQADIRKIDINTASAEVLDAHPYISSKQAKLIVGYREQHGAFTAVDDLARIAVFSDRKWLEKVKPYLVAK